LEKTTLLGIGKSKQMGGARKGEMCGMNNNRQKKGQNTNMENKKRVKTEKEG